MRGLGAAIAAVVAAAVGTAGDSVLARLAIHEHFSQFLALVSDTPGPHSAHLDTYVTMFAPTNEALESYGGPRDQNFILNHLVSTSVAPEELGTRLESLRPGHPPLWISMHKRKIGKNIFVNQARVIRNIPLVTQNKTQHLYLIDSVLKCAVPNDSSDDIIDSDRSEHFMDYLESSSFGNHTTKMFAARLRQLGMEKFPEFGKIGKFTFFIPVDAAFENLQPLHLDEEVVRAHVVPGHVLFTRPRRLRPQPVATSQHGSKLSLSVVVKLLGEAEDSVVQSVVVVGSTRHQRGVVSARVVAGGGDLVTGGGGVLHLIDTPLVVRPRPLAQLLAADPRYSSFHAQLAAWPESAQLLAAARNMTLLVPTNEAFRRLGNRSLDEATLRLHLLDTLVLEEDINWRNESNPLAVSPRHWMWRGWVEADSSRAEVMEARLASNGMVYSVSSVLGTPGLNIRDTLRRLQHAGKTFQLGKQKNFNSLLERNDTMFTLFVPTDKAWSKVGGGVYTQLARQDRQYAARHLLEHHLMAGTKLSLATLAADQQLRAAVVRGPDLAITRSEDNLTLVTGHGVVARVVRGDIECTNGYIHLVDSVIMRDQEVRLESATAGPGQRSPYLALLVVLVLYLIKTVPFIKLVI